ncbi:MAG: DUF2079 domain-containing protein, partial [Candidatus Eremiobacteraeota bacterium]|nr:DUF2079 domain-containing protein [Candidatus Eremiobacteraeota bacterium]
ALFSRWMLVVFPGLAIVVLSSDPSAWRMGNHYAALWAPWLLVAAAQTIVGKARASRVTAGRFAWAVVACCAIVLVAFDPMHPGHYLRAPYADRADARRAFGSIPPDASTFTHDEWFARMTGRRPALEHVWNEPEYAVLADDFPNAFTFLPFIRLEVARGCYAVERRYAAVVVYGRTKAATTQTRCRIDRP